VNDSAIRLIGEVFLLWGLGWLGWWMFCCCGCGGGSGGGTICTSWWCWYAWMLSGAVVVWLWELLICVRDNSWVVGWLRLRHPVSGGLRFWAVSCWVRAVFAVEQAVKSARLLRPSSAPTTSSVAAALGGILLAARGLASGVLVGDVVYLLLIVAVPTGV
jgi:hypothetical protein